MQATFLNEHSLVRPRDIVQRFQSRQGAEWVVDSQSPMKPASASASGHTAGQASLALLQIQELALERSESTRLHGVQRQTGPRLGL